MTSGLALAGLTVAGLGLAGCGIRLEDDAPDIPFVPTRRPVPAEPALVALARDCADLAEAAAALDGALPQALGEIHRRQQGVIHDALRALGVPATVLSPSPSPGAGSMSPLPSGSAASTAASSPASAAPTGTGATTPKELGELERAGLGAEAALADAPPTLMPSLVSLLAQRRAAAVLLGAPAPMPAPPPPAGSDPSASSPPGTPTPSSGTSTSGASSAAPSPAPSTATSAPTQVTLWASPDPVVPLLPAGRRAAYLFEVVASRTTKVTRSTAVATVGVIRALVRAQEAFVGDAAPPPELGQALPFEADDIAGVRRLARTAITDLRTAYGAQLPALATTPEAGLRHGAAWLGSVEALARRWGVALEPFPGLQ